METGAVRFERTNVAHAALTRYRRVPIVHSGTPPIDSNAYGIDSGENALLKMLAELLRRALIPHGTAR